MVCTFRHVNMHLRILLKREVDIAAFKILMEVVVPLLIDTFKRRWWLKEGGGRVGTRSTWLGGAWHCQVPSTASITKIERAQFIWEVDQVPHIVRINLKALFINIRARQSRLVVRLGGISVCSSGPEFQCLCPPTWCSLTKRALAIDSTKKICLELSPFTFLPFVKAYMASLWNNIPIILRDNSLQTHPKSSPQSFGCQ